MQEMEEEIERCETEGERELAEDLNRKLDEAHELAEHLDRERELERQLDLEWYIYSKSPVGTFNQQMHDIMILLDVSVSHDTEFSLLVMLYGHSVASVESYLASFFIRQVTNSEDLIRRLVETDPKFSKMKFTLKEIYEKQENLKFIVAKYLKDLIFHDLKKIKPMFKNVLECDFGDISWLFKAVRIRHHCVHRAGLNKDGERIDISRDSIQKIVDQSTELVEKIEQIASPDIHPYKKVP